MLDSLRDRLAGTTPSKRLVLILVLTALGATHCAPASWNDESRMATVQSLVESRSFVIDRSDFASTGDKVFINGHFYSDKPPMPALLGAIAYAPLYCLGLRLHEGNSIAYFMVTLFTVSFVWLLGTLAFFHSLRFTGLDEERRLLASIALGLGTIYFSWSTAFNNHELAAGFLAIGFCFFLKAREEAGVRKDLCVAALFFSLAATSDMPTGIFYVLFFLEILREPRLRKSAIFFVLPLMLTIVPTLAINFSIHHSIMPVQIYQSYFEYPGSPWMGSDQLSGMRTNDFKFFCTYAYLTLFGSRGFLLYDPLVLIALWGLGITIKRRERFFREGLIVASGSAAIMLYYWLSTNNYGGWSYSIRWFVPLIPLLFFFVYPYLQELDSKRMSRFRVLLGVSVIIAFVGAINPWSPDSYSYVPFVANIKQFVAHLQRPTGVRMGP